MKLKRLFSAIMIVVLCISMAACGGNSAAVSEPVPTPSPNPGGFAQINMQAFKKILESSTGDEYVLLDVRHDYEFEEGHLPGAINVDNSDLLDTIETIITDKDTVIYVYCRSGRRSLVASDTLVRLGYSHVVEIGGILDWKGETEN